MKKHINNFFSLKCAPDLIQFFQLGHSSAGKEVTESIGIFRAAEDIFKHSIWEPRVAIIVGDGGTPRTGAVFAYLTKWDVFTLDPEFNWDKWLRIKAATNPQRLTVIKNLAENLRIDCKGLPCLLVLPHSHADFEASLKLPVNYSQLDVISMPCCHPIKDKWLTIENVKRYDLKMFVDPDVWSPKRTMYLWRNINTQSAA